MSGGGKVHRGGVYYTAAEAARRRKRPCASPPTVPTNVRIVWQKRHEHHSRVFNAHVKWDAVTDDVAGRPLTPELYQVELQATDASGEPLETQDQLEASNTYASDWSVASGSAPVTLHHRTLSGAAVIETTLTGLTAGLDARANFYLRKVSTGGTVKCEVYNSTDGSTVVSKNVTPSKTAKPDTTASMAFTPVTGKTYKARVTWVSGSGSVIVDTVQWHTNGDTATWNKVIHADEAHDAHFHAVVKPDSWYYRARVRVMNRVPGGKCWSTWSDWTAATQPATGEPTGPPAPDGLSLSFDRVDGHRADPWRARVSFNEVGPFVTPDGDAHDGARHYHVQLQTSNDGGTHVANTRRVTIPAEPDQAKLHADFWRIHGKRKYRARVRSVSKHGVLGAWSSWTSGWHGPNGAPTDVTGLTWSNPTPATLVARWSAPTDPTDAYRYHVQVIRASDSTVVDDGFTASTRWRYDIPKADRGVQHRVTVVVQEPEPTLDADPDDGSGGSTAYDTPDASTGTTSSDLSNSEKWDETDIVLISGEISDGNAPASSPTPTVTGGPGYLAVKWSAVSNVDRVTYDVYVDSTDHGSTAAAWLATTKVGSVDGTLFFAKTDHAGAALAYGTTYYVAVIARDADGASTAALTRGSGAMVQAGTADIAADAITATQIAAGAVTASEIAAGAVTATAIHASAIDGFLITGATFTTTDGNVVMDDTGFHAYDTTGAPTVNVDTSGAAEFAGAITGGLIAIAPSTGVNFDDTFTSYAVPVLPTANWTRMSTLDSTNYTADDSHWTVKTAVGSGSVSGKTLTYSITSGVAPSNTGWAPTTEEDVLNAEAYAQFRTNQLPSPYDHINVISARETVTNSGYALSIQGAFFGSPGAWINGPSGQLVFVPVSDGSALAINTWYKAKLRVVGTSIWAKLWKASAAEPKAWQASVVDTDQEAAGWWGVSLGQNSLFDPAGNLTVDWAEFKVTPVVGAFNVDATGNMFMGADSFAGAKLRVSAAGEIRVASGVGSSDVTYVGTDAGTTTRTTYGSTLTGSASGMTLNFTAPPSGRITVLLSGWLKNSAAAGIAYLSVTITDTTTSTVKYAAADGTALQNQGTNGVQATNQFVLGGLTPGNAHTAVLQFRTSASNTASFDNFRVSVLPSLGA